MSPFNAWVLLKGLETLPLRVKQQTETCGARSPISWPNHECDRKVIYPGRKDHPQADIIAKQMTGGSTLVAFEVEGRQGGRLQACRMRWRSSRFPTISAMPRA